MMDADQPRIPDPIDPQPTQQVAPPENSMEMLPTRPPIAGFWRRLFAWIIDGLILGVLGQILGFIFSSFFYQLGPYGRLIGLLFVLPYFGILNSTIGGGQTIGKRLMHIAVRDRENNPISLGKSLLRIIILYVPILLNNWSLPILRNPFLAFIVAMIVFGLGGAVFYTMIFNRKPRQGYHDMLLGTYVVDIRYETVDPMPATTNIHWVITGVWFSVVLVLGGVGAIFNPFSAFLTQLSPLEKVMNSLNTDPRVISTGVNDNTFRGSDGTQTRSLTITIWYKGNVGEIDKEALATDFMKTVLSTVEKPDAYSYYQIKLTTAFDIGIASRYFSYNFSDTLDGWRQRIGSDSSSGFIFPLFTLVGL
jgi:uncharacterized RDD family membrane protein YckC